MITTALEGKSQSISLLLYFTQGDEIILSVERNCPTLDFFETVTRVPFFHDDMEYTKSDNFIRWVLTVTLPEVDSVLRFHHGESYDEHYNTYQSLKIFLRDNHLDFFLEGEPSPISEEEFLRECQSLSFQLFVSKFEESKNRNPREMILRHTFNKIDKENLNSSEVRGWMKILTEEPSVRIYFRNNHMSLNTCRLYSIIKGYFTHRTK